MIPDDTFVKSAARHSRRSLAVLGATGSIGTQTLEIAALFPERFQVHTLAGGDNLELLAEQVMRFRPKRVVIRDAARVAAFRKMVGGYDPEVVGGREAIESAVEDAEVDIVVAAIVGFAGLAPVIAAVKAGKLIALANKETLVVAGGLIKRLLRNNPSAVIPVDSEHSAIFQCLVGEPVEAVEELILTASGGPFRSRPYDTFEDITPDEALRHPNWSMGAKVTIDSATLMNKGLEVIEAHWLFDLAAERISVLVHPQSIIHSMVTFRDGSTKAQLGVPDMKIPIQYALSFPERWPAPHQRIDWSELRSLDFEEPDTGRFPCLALAYDALASNGTAPAVLNAANEQAVELFLSGRIAFTEIPSAIELALDAVHGSDEPDLRELEEVDRDARRFVKELKLPKLNRTPRF